MGRRGKVRWRGVRAPTPTSELEHLKHQLRDGTVAAQAPAENRAARRKKAKRLRSETRRKK
jgi:hypothetical protein